MNNDVLGFAARCGAEFSVVRLWASCSGFFG